MSAFDEGQHPRGQAGKFTTRVKAGAGVTLAGGSPGPILADVTPGDSLYLDRFEHGDPVLEAVEVTPQRRRPRDRPRLGHRHGVGRPRRTAPRRARGQGPAGWLDEHQYVIEAYLEDAYGVSGFEGDGSDGLDYVVARFDVDLPADVPLGELTEAIHARSRAADLYNEQDPGTFGVPNMWRGLADHLRRHETEAGPHTYRA